MPRAQGWSEREVERRSAALARLLRRAWRAVSRAVSGSLSGRPDAPVTAANLVQPTWNQHVDGDVIALVGDVYRDAAEDVLLDVGAPGDLLVGEDLVQLYLRTASNRLRGVGDRAWERVRDQLLEGQRLGRPLDDIAARISGTGGISDARALVIARTEVHAAAESAAWEQARFVDPEALKIWLATNDERTRPTHRAAEGQAVTMDELFVVGDSKLRFPGDPLGDADETINCRCTLVFDLESFDPTSSDVDEDALIAAGKKWTPSKHPRGKDGRFIKKGTVQELLSKKKPLITDVTNAVYDLDEKQWKNLTDEQKTYLQESVAKLPLDSQIQKDAQSKLDALQALEPVKLKVPKKPGPGTKKATSAAPSGAEIPAHKGATSGSPVKVTTALIWGKYPPGTVILEAPDEQVTWDGKKYVHSVQGLAQAEWTKKDAYAHLKNDTHWTVPGGAVAPEPTAENFTADMKAMWQSQWEKGLVTAEEFEAQFGEPPSDPDGPVAQLPSKSEIKGQSGMSLEAGQALWDKGLMSLNEFEDEFGLSPAGYVDPGPVAPGTPTPTPAVADWPDKADMSVAKSPTGAPLAGSTASSIQAQLDAAATKPVDFDPTAGVQEGRAAFYVATQSHPYDPSSEDEWHALRTYQSLASTHGWNESLRKDIPLEQTALNSQQIVFVKKAQPKLDEMMAASSLPATVRVWRGVRDEDGELAAKLTKGSIFEDKAYVSTATDKSVAEAFAGSGGLYFDIEVPKGEQGLVPTVWSGRFLDEWELVLPRGSKFEVLEAPKLVNGQRTVKVRVVTNEHDDIKAPEPAPAVAETSAEAPTATPPAPTPTPAATSAPGVHVPGEPLTPDLKATFLGFLKMGGTLSDAEVVDLTRALDVADWNGLTDEQKTALVVRIDDALDAGASNANFAFKHLNDVMYEAKKTGITSTPQVEQLSVPPPLLPIDLPYSPEMFQTGQSLTLGEGKKYLVDTTHPEGTVVGRSASGQERLVAAFGSPIFADKSTYRRERLDSATNEWVSVEHNIVGLKAIQIIRGSPQSSSAYHNWVVPQSLLQKSLSSPSASVPTPTPTLTPPSVPSVPSVPAAPEVKLTPVGAGHKILFKQAFKNAKVGYWSKPEAIWEQVKELRLVYPQFTPLQILQSLDEQLKTKEPTPFQTKMIKWLGTPKGKQVAGQDASLGQASAPQVSPSVAPSSAPASSTATSPPGKLPTADSVDHVSQETKSDLYAAFKNLPGTYFTSEQTTIYAAAKNVAETYGLNVLQALKIIDEVGAQKVNKPNEQLFEKKITAWLKTKTGAAAVGVSGAATAAEAGIASLSAADNPRIPALPKAFNPNALLPSFSQSSGLDYANGPSTTTEALTFWNASIAQYGPWTSSQRTALKQYTAEHFEQVNDYLWNSGFADNATLARIKRIQAGMRPSTAPIRLIRGTSHGVAGKTTLEGLKKLLGQTWRSDGFMSSSVGSYPGFGAGNKVWIEIDAPPGTPMAWVDHISENPGEREMLIAAGLHYRITGVEERYSSYDAQTKIVVKVRVVPKPKGGAQ